MFQQVRLSEAEHRELGERAAELGVSVPRLMVEAALEGRGTPADRVTTAERDPTGKLIGTRHAHVWRLALPEPAHVKQKCT
jgi:hypothetical protein